MIRVFARKTNYTPTDDMAFYGDPPLFVLDEYKSDYPVAVSVTFTWDKAKGMALAKSWSQHFRKVQIGGPAFDDPGSYFFSGRFIKKGITFTSRGCPKRCPWCLVPKREGKLRELLFEPGHIIQDNNLLACSTKHIKKVFLMLARQKKGIEFRGGLDIDYLEPWHVEMLKKIKIGKTGLCVACDRPEDLKRLDKAADMLRDFSIERKRCYVLIGRDGETRAQAQARCEAVLAKGFLPFAQLYRDVNSSQSRGEWRDLCYFWAKPGLYRKKFGNNK